MSSLAPADDLPRSASELAAALFNAAAEGDLDLTRRLLDAGASAGPVGIEWNTALMAAAGNGHAECVKILLPASNPNQTNGDGENALHKAVEADSVECVALLAPVCDTSRRQSGSGFTPLMMATACQMLEAVRLLAPLSDLEATDATNRGRTALELARLWGSGKDAEFGQQIIEILTAEPARREREALLAASQGTRDDAGLPSAPARGPRAL
jgi:hypothetical protein